MNSMTGYGTAEGSCPGAKVRVEISSVNRKQLEILLTLPAGWGAVEPRFREIVSTHCSRGMVRVTLTLSGRAQYGGIDTERARAAHTALCRLVRELGLSQQPRLEDVLRFPGVVTDCAGASPQPTPEVMSHAERILKTALSCWNNERSREGRRLVADITKRLSLLVLITKKINRTVPRLKKSTQDRVRNQLSLLLGDQKNSPSLAEAVRAEVISAALRGDFTEELTRLDAHLVAFKKHLMDNQSRHLEFLAQEINRELNTVASKCSDADVAHLVVAAKAEIEKIREQLANLE